MELRDVGVAPQLQLAQERITRTHELHTGWIDVYDARGVPAATDSKGFSPRIVGDRTAIVFHTIADARTIHRDQVALVLDRARAREDVPMPASPLRPVRDQKRGVHLRRNGAEELRKAQVVTDEQPNSRSFDVDDDGSVAGGIHLVL